MRARRSSQANRDGFERVIGEEILGADDPLGLFLGVYAPEMLPEWLRLRDHEAGMSPAVSHGSSKVITDWAGKARLDCTSGGCAAPGGDEDDA